MKNNKAYCLVYQCPFTDCEKHLKNCPTLKGKVHLIDYAATCRDYIGWLLDEIESEKGR